jgi:hypothetical protein
VSRSIKHAALSSGSLSVHVIGSRYQLITNVYDQSFSGPYQ